MTAQTLTPDKRTPAGPAALACAIIPAWVLLTAEVYLRPGGVEPGGGHNAPRG